MCILYIQCFFVFVYVSTYHNCKNKCTLCTCCNCFLSYYFLGPDATVQLSLHKDLPKGESQPDPSAAAVKQDILPPPEGAVKTQDSEAETSKLFKNNLTEEKDMEVMDAHEEATRTEGKELRIRCIEFSSTCVFLPNKRFNSIQQVQIQS